MGQPIAEETLEKYLRSLTNKLLENNASLKDQPGLIDKVVSDTTSIIRYKEAKSKTVVTMKELLNPDFINQISTTIIAQAVIQGSEEERKFMAELMEAINQLRAGNAYHNEFRSALQEQEALLNDINDIMNELSELMTLSPEVLDKLQQKLRKNLQKKLNKQLLKKLEKILNLKLNPKNKESLRDLLRRLVNEIRANIESLKKNKTLDKTMRPVSEDVYMNLFGLLNSYIAGSIAVPLTQYIGNGLGFNDWNPYHGYANIDKINELNFMFGDSLGMEADTLRNYFSLDDDVVSDLQDLLRSEGFTQENTAPNPFDIKHNPK